MSEIVICNRCGSTNPSGSKYCANCGQLLTTLDSLTEPKIAYQTLHCNYCQHPNHLQAIYCENCGRALSNVEDNEKGRECPSCHQQNPISAGFCGYCGQALDLSTPASANQRNNNNRLLLVVVASGLVFLLASGAFLLLPKLDAGSSLLPGPSLQSTEAIESLSTITAVDEQSTSNSEAVATSQPVATDIATSIVESTPSAQVTITETMSGELTMEVTVPATSERFNTNIIVDAGQLITIEHISGNWRAGPSPTWPEVGPEGDTQVSSKDTFPIPDRPVMTLIGGIGIGSSFAIGSRIEILSRNNGSLWLGPNDDGPSDNDGELQVRVMVADPPHSVQELTGDTLVQLTFGEERDSSPILSADQRRLLYTSEQGVNTQIMDADVDGNRPARLLTRGNADFFSPHPSLDGKTLLVSSDVFNPGEGYDIYLLDAFRGLVLQQLIRNPGDDYYPQWLPDETGFIFSSDQSGNHDIYLGRLDGTQQRLTDNPGFDGFGTVSPDGSQIAFYSDRDGDYEIYIMDSNGSDPRRVTTSRGRDASPAFSPDGEWIAFESERDGDYDIFVMRPDGSDVRQVTDNIDGDWAPSFSPDGKWLLFQSNRTGNMDIFRQPFFP